MNAMLWCQRLLIVSRPVRSYTWPTMMLIVRIHVVFIIASVHNTYNVSMQSVVPRSSILSLYSYVMPCKVDIRRALGLSYQINL